MRKNSFLAISALAGLATLLNAAPPAGWFMAGSKPTSYESGVDQAQAVNGLPSAYMKSVQDVTDGFGTLMQNFSASKYLGKRVRLSANVKSDKVAQWAGLWMRVDGDSPDPQKHTLSFDNMQTRPIKGTTDWKKYEVVLDVPDGATGIFFGVLLTGTGEVWMNDFKLEEVSTSVPTTSALPIPPPSTPQNLNFEK